MPKDFFDLFVIDPPVKIQGGGTYTDRKIEKEVGEHFKGLIEEKTGKKVKVIGWSEQGMQPRNGWNFDLVFKD